ILGEILSKIGNKPLDVLLREKVLDPMGLKNTTASQTSEIPSPVLHAYDSERRTGLKIPANVPFYEESSFWNSQWGTPIGAKQTTRKGTTTIPVTGCSDRSARTLHRRIRLRLCPQRADRRSSFCGAQAASLLVSAASQKEFGLRQVREQLQKLDLKP